MYFYHIYTIQIYTSMPRYFMSAKCHYMGWEGDKVKDMLDEVEENSSGLWPAIEKIRHRYRKSGK